MNWYLEVLKKYAVFDGRSRRREFWYFVLFSSIVAIALMIIDITAGTHYAFLGIYCLAVLLPGLGVSIRRLHDTNRSGWWVLVNLYPAVGQMFFILFTAAESDVGENQYGPNPKAIPTTA
jgi:uncharacterized membrane protein YhaH (DUF805 family)